MEKQERIPGDQTKTERGRSRDRETKTKSKLNFKLNLPKNVSQTFKKHLVCLQIISSMFSLS